MTGRLAEMAQLQRDKPHCKNVSRFEEVLLATVFTVLTKKIVIKETLVLPWGIAAISNRRKMHSQ